MRKKNIFQINVKDIIGTNHLFVGDIAGVISIIKNFDSVPDVDKEVRIEVYTHGYRPWALDALGFIFGSGLAVEKNIMSLGLYMPSDMNYCGRRVVLNGSMYSNANFRKLADHITSLDSSRKKKDRIEKVRLTNALAVYNKALLLKQNRTNIYSHSEESYLNLLRLLDGLVVAGNAWDFADKIVTGLSEKYVNKHYKKMRRLKLYVDYHIPIAEELFTVNKSYIKKKIDIARYNKSKAKRVFLISLYALYQFRNKWIHNGFPLPEKEVLINNSTSNFFGISVGASLQTKDHLRGGVSMSGFNYISYEKLIYEVAPPPTGMSANADYGKLYVLWPTWYFLNSIVRESLKKEFGMS